MSSALFWSHNQVGGPYKTRRASLAALAERQLRYPNLLDLMPVERNGGTVLDYGCGPGHDTILFCQNGADYVFYYDISPLALEIVRDRLRMHGLSRATACPPVVKVDHIHCAGVLHHTEDPERILRDFRRMLNPGGEARVMIYDGDRSVHSQSEVPITEWWTEEDFQTLCSLAAFNAEYVGGYDCSAPWRPSCMAACYRLTTC